jgi:type II secretory pathway pseudopilin PulG
MVRQSSNPRVSRTRTFRAFSLAELLVVTGVIALLIAITLPPLQYAKRQAMRTQCSAQLQQFGRA